jgi:hypothetical protein
MSEKIDTVVFSPAKGKAKKIRAVFFAKDKKKATREFGARGMQDFTLYSKKDKKLANERKKLYDNRHKAREDWTDMLSNGALSKWVLWDKPNLQSSMRSFGKRFNLKVKINM